MQKLVLILTREIQLNGKWKLINVSRTLGEKLLELITLFKLCINIKLNYNIK